jgi:uncharacterized protein (UPF0128 family)
MINYNNPVKNVVNLSLEQNEMKESILLNRMYKKEVLNKLKKEIKNKVIYFDLSGKCFIQ